MTKQLATRSSVSVALSLTTLAELREFCSVLAGTDMVPKGYKGKPDDILVAMLHGQEVGLPHLQALQSIAVVNGIPSIYGDAGLALVRASGKLDSIDEWLEVDGVRQDGPFPILSDAKEGKQIVAFCKTKRVGMEEYRTTTFSVDDAERAKLWLKKGANGFETPWCTVPQRMLMWRARGWNLRDQFGDVLKGLAIYEEAIDIVPVEVQGAESEAAQDVNAAALAEGKAKLAIQQAPHAIIQPQEAQSQPQSPLKPVAAPTGPVKRGRPRADQPKAHADEPPPVGTPQTDPKPLPPPASLDGMVGDLIAKANDAQTSDECSAVMKEAEQYKGELGQLSMVQLDLVETAVHERKKALTEKK